MKYLFLFIISFNCLADEWRTEDTNREIAYQIVAVMDWAQTRNISRNPEKLHEINPILGEHPNIDKVDAYFAIMALAHYSISYSINDEFRSAWQYITIGIESGTVSHNLKLGISIKF